MLASRIYHSSKLVTDFLKFLRMAPNENNHQNSNGQTKIPVAVIMVPFAAQGHMNQLLHLTRLISLYNIPVHFVSTTTHAQQAKSRFFGADPLHVHFHEYPVPPSHPPPPSVTTSNTGKIPGLFKPSVDASFHLRDPVAKLMSALSPTAERLVVIHDFLASASVQDIVSIPTAEAYTFHGVSAFFAFTYFWEMYGKPPILEDAAIEYLPPINTSFTPEFLEHVDKCLSYVKLFMRGIIYDGCRLLEGKYIDLTTCQEMMGEHKQWALGPFNPVSVAEKKESNDRHKCLKWLDEQDPNSVIYVCFGTTVSLVEQQVEELAIGLEKSEQKFIWVLRDADKEVLCKEERGSVKLPKGYEERVKGQGMVIRDWAPQLEILGHRSTGGFLSHCGWNSCMESLSFGVPIAAWPNHSDQPRNSLLITKGLKTGIMVRDWALGHEKLVTWLTVEKAVRRLMASKEGEEVRRRAVEVSGDLRGSVAEGGVTRVELDSFISHITR